MEMKHVLIVPIHIYQKYLSGLKRYTHCKFSPTCSQYAVEAIEKYGAAKGSLMAAKRILRCNPFNRDSGYDPVP